MKEPPEIVSKFAKYLLVGIVNTIGFYLLILLFGKFLAIYYAVFLGHSVMVVFSYLMNNKYVFEFGLRKHKFLFISMSLVCSNYILSYQLDIHGFGDNVIAAIIIAVTTIIGFLANYFFNYKRN